MAGDVDEAFELLLSEIEAHLHREIRWRNTAQWARKTIVQEGLLASDSPKEIWEITRKGREYLKAYEERRG